MKSRGSRAGDSAKARSTTALISASDKARGSCAFKACPNQSNLGCIEIMIVRSLLLLCFTRPSQIEHQKRIGKQEIH